MGIFRPETRRTRRALARGGGAAASGLLVAASLPPLGYWFAAPLGIALLALVTARVPWRRRLLLGFVSGLAQFAVGLLFVAAFTLVGDVVLVVTEALTVAAACALVPARRGHALALAGTLTLAEAVRDAVPFGGMPLAGIALGQVGGPLLPLARLGGPLALVGAAALLGVGLARCAEAVARRRIAGAPAGVAALVVVVVTAFVSGSLFDGTVTGRLRAAAVQGGGRRGLTSLEAPPSAVFGATLAASAQLGRLRGGLVLWPEDAVPLTEPLAVSGAQRVLADVARRSGATLLAGVTAPRGPTHFVNELVAFAPSGRLIGHYEKVHPVPFGEYVPGRSLLRHFFSLAAVPRDMVRGQRVGVLSTPAGRIGALLSYESFFPGLARAEVRAGAGVLVVATNTASYATAQVPDEELAASRLDAVACGRDLLQAATVGRSALVSADGQVTGATALGAPATVRVSLGLRGGETPYVALGQWPVITLAALAGALGGALGEREDSRRRRRRRETSAGVGRGLDRRTAEQVGTA